MFRGLINDAKSAFGEVLARYATRAIIGVLFAVAAGFAVAAITVQLVASFGAITAFWMLAGGFAVIGLIGIAVENLRETTVDAQANEAVRQDTESVATAAAAEAVLQLPIALLGSVVTSSAGPLSVLGLLRFLGRNFSLVVLVALVAMLFWPQVKTEAGAEEAGPVPEPPVP